ncbi:SDR family NAD(P)-dependent oxidoreductase [Ilumatobacter nonamiensis]|uniref:SDR family NAD(P)-dependent oxidoreductase n=1 Tax=Ilumatobacter nonamiensis TaxID=467093 RepID=UPI00034674C0|nr:SDR family oxidoreductase [Ilumatobacter nonamiensis]
MIDFTGRQVLVAGGSSGIGLGTARRFQMAGADVHVTGTRASAADYPDGDLDGLVFHQLDVADPGAAEALATGFDALDVLVPSVGTVAYGGAEYDIDTFRQVVDVNLNGVMALCTAFRSHLTESEAASIVIIGSTSSFIATPGQPAYSASKGALVTLTKSLAAAWAKHGIRVNGVAPGFVNTKLTSRSHDDPDVYESTISRIPMRRWGEPEEMGDAALFLASSMAGYVTGQMLLVDGGITLM